MSRFLTSVHVSVCLVTLSAEPTKVGDEAKDFALKSLKDDAIKLSYESQSKTARDEVGDNLGGCGSCRAAND